MAKQGLWSLRFDTGLGRGRYKVQQLRWCIFHGFWGCIGLVDGSAGDGDVSRSSRTRPRKYISVSRSRDRQQGFLNGFFFSNHVISEISASWSSSVFVGQGLMYSWDRSIMEVDRRMLPQETTWSTRVTESEELSGEYFQSCMSLYVMNLTNAGCQMQDIFCQSSSLYAKHAFTPLPQIPKPFHNRHHA